MFTEIKLGDAVISYANCKRVIKQYDFKYTNPINDVKSEYTIWISYDNTTNYELFVVEDYFGLHQAFDTYKDANTYAYSCIKDKYEKLLVEQQEIENYVAKHNKRSKKNGLD